MRLSHQDDHEGWTISTECREDNLEDWKPGDPIRYVAWGSATLKRDNTFLGTWASKAPQSFPHTHFSDYNQAHREIRSNLIAKIDSLKQAA